jgi:hypothetical protein
VKEEREVMPLTTYVTLREKEGLMPKLNKPIDVVIVARIPG